MDIERKLPISVVTSLKLKKKKSVKLFAIHNLIEQREVVQKCIPLF